MSVPLIASRITLAAHETGGTIGIVENVVEPGWPGPPLHHHAFDETFCILEGELTFQVGADRRMGRAGDTLFVVRGAHHTLANLSGGHAVSAVYSRWFRAAVRARRRQHAIRSQHRRHRGRPTDPQMDAER